MVDSIIATTSLTSLFITMGSAEAAPALTVTSVTKRKCLLRMTGSTLSAHFLSLAVPTRFTTSRSRRSSEKRPRTRPAIKPLAHSKAMTVSA